MWRGPGQERGFKNSCQLLADLLHKRRGTRAGEDWSELNRTALEASVHAVRHKGLKSKTDHV
jgi:hypothetical protein